MSTIVAVGLQGRSLIGGKAVQSGGTSFTAYNPVDGTAVEPAYFSASSADVDAAVAVATAAFEIFASTPDKERAVLLRTIADGLDAAAPELIARAHLETALPIARLTGEVARTSGQMRHFATVLEEGSWVSARIETADPARTPPKPDLRSMLRPLGPVVVFGASNFPLAFSVAGGDTASALAAGNPVIVKAHAAHPGTSELAGLILSDAVKKCGLPDGVFSLLFDAGHEVGAALVQDPDVKAVGFTGSFRGGRALMDLAAKRETPIPVYAEMGSTNPVFILPGALAKRGETLAKGLHGSFTLGGGQFCTKPGLVFASQDEAFTATLRANVEATTPFSLLTRGIAQNFAESINGRASLRTAHGAEAGEGFSAQVTLLETTGDAFLREPSLAEEVFGPATLLIHCSGREQMLQAARGLAGHLTATVLGTEQDLVEHADLLRVLESRVGRVIFNAFPTGVEVNHAMVHGGPYPATSDGRSTSVGGQAIFRFTRPVSYQGMPQAALHPALHDGNPLGIFRMWNGTLQI
jgi:alpha-ketoglutaric semialdehyde dehydrogenase